MSNNNDNSRLNKVLECVAFFGVACIAISLIFAICFQGNNVIYISFKTVGDGIAYSLSIVLAFLFVKRQKHIAWLICYVVFVVVIVVLYVIGLVHAI